jgi:outer membrane protein assembly factor BamB
MMKLITKQTMGRLKAPSLALLSSLACAGAAGQDWPQFRGPRSAGTAEGEGLPEKWSATENVLWKAEVPGRGWSSPVVASGKVFLTATVSGAPEEEPKKGLYFGGNRDKPGSAVHRWMVFCLDLESGKLLWEKMAHQGVPAFTHHLKNTFASETPVTDGERLYVHFGNLGLFAYDLEGRPLWSRRWESVKTRYGWGTASSPALHGGRLFVVNDNEESSFLLALDARTGQELWRRPREEKSNWSSPLVWENPIRTELVTTGSSRVRSYDLEGNLLWQLAGMSSITIPTPVAGSGLLFVSSGYVMDQLRPLYAIRPGAKGDISLKEGENGNGSIAWSQRKAGPYNPSPLAYRDHLYVLFDRGFLSCHQAETGKDLYSQKRLGEGSGFTASPWAYGGKVFCLSEEGDTFVVEGGPEFKLLGKNSLGEMCMATPAIVKKSILIRTLGRLYRIGNGSRAR